MNSAVTLSTTEKKCVVKGRAVGKSTDWLVIDEAADLDLGEFEVQKERYQEHYQEKALSTNLMTGIDIDIAIVDEVTAEPTYDDYRAGGFGAQTPSDSKHLNNLKKKRAWSRRERKHLPPWMRR